MSTLVRRMGLLAPPHARVFRYGSAAAVTVTALLATAALRPHIGHATFPFFYVAVALSARYWGFDAALVAATLSAVTSAFLMPPLFGVEDRGSAIHLVMFVLTSLLIASLASARSRAERDTKAALAERRQLLAREQAARAEAERALAEARVATSGLAFVAHASAVLSSSLDYDETLRTLARLVVPLMADWCSVDVVENDGAVRRVAVVNADPAKAEIVRAAAAYP